MLKSEDLRGQASERVFADRLTSSAPENRIVSSGKDGSQEPVGRTHCKHDRQIACTKPSETCRTCQINIEVALEEQEWGEDFRKMRNATGCEMREE